MGHDDPAVHQPAPIRELHLGTAFFLAYKLGWLAGAADHGRPATWLILSSLEPATVTAFPPAADNARPQRASRPTADRHDQQGATVARGAMCEWAADRARTYIPFGLGISAFLCVVVATHGR